MNCLRFSFIWGLLLTIVVPNASLSSGKSELVCTDPDARRAENVLLTHMNAAAENAATYGKLISDLEGIQGQETKTAFRLMGVSIAGNVASVAANIANFTRLTLNTFPTLIYPGGAIQSVDDSYQLILQKPEDEANSDGTLDQATLQAWSQKVILDTAELQGQVLGALSQVDQMESEMESGIAWDSVKTVGTLGRSNISHFNQQILMNEFRQRLYYEEAMILFRRLQRLRKQCGLPSGG
jgi:hypothetical protein